MRPLGPFNGKSSGTSISPWVVSPEALDAFRTASQPRQVPVADYLDDPGNSSYDISLQVSVSHGQASATAGSMSLSAMYWSARQTTAHFVSTGAGLNTGDLLASGTVSSEADGGKGCLLETTQAGAVPLKLSDGSSRRYLEDGDVVRITGFAGDAESGVGFGECVGELTPSRPFT